MRITSFYLPKLFFICLFRTRRRATTTTDHFPILPTSIHPLEKLDSSQQYTRQRTRSTGWTDFTPKPSKSSQDSARTSRRRSLYATRPAVQPSVSSAGKLSKLLVRRRKLARIPISKSLPSLLAPVAGDDFQTPTPSSYADHKNISPKEVPSLPTSSLSLNSTKKEFSQPKSDLSFRNGKTESIIDVLIAAATVHDNDDKESLPRSRASGNNAAGRSVEPSPDITPEAPPAALDKPLPPVENDPHIFDLLESVNSCVIHYWTPTQSVGGELGSSSTERKGGAHTAGEVISAATIEKLIEKLTSVIGE